MKQRDEYFEDEYFESILKVLTVDEYVELLKEIECLLNDESLSEDYNDFSKVISEIREELNKTDESKKLEMMEEFDGINDSFKEFASALLFVIRDSIKKEIEKKKNN